MKKLITALTLSTTLVSCTTTPGNNTQAIITQIANATVAACGFLPAASTIANLVSVTVGGGAIVGQVEVIAQQICAAATTALPPPTTAPTPLSVRRRAAQSVTVVVNGVQITGHFVR